MKEGGGSPQVRGVACNKPLGVERTVQPVMDRRGSQDVKRIFIEMAALAHTY